MKVLTPGWPLRARSCLRFTHYQWGHPPCWPGCVMQLQRLILPPASLDHSWPQLPHTGFLGSRREDGIESTGYFLGTDTCERKHVWVEEGVQVQWRPDKALANLARSSGVSVTLSQLPCERQTEMARPFYLQPFIRFSVARWWWQPWERHYLRSLSSLQALPQARLLSAAEADPEGADSWTPCVSTLPAGGQPVLRWSRIWAVCLTLPVD